MWFGVIVAAIGSMALEIRRRQAEKLCLVLDAQEEELHEIYDHVDETDTVDKIDTLQAEDTPMSDAEYYEENADHQRGNVVEL